MGNAIAIDGSGNAYTAGLTWSSNFPVTPGAFNTTYNGGTSDAFVTKLNASGSALIYSTFLGGGDDDGNWAVATIAIDGSGNAYITGQTLSTDFPTTPGAFDTAYNGVWDAFVTKLNADGSALIYSTFLGGVDQEGGRGITVDESGNAYVAGRTWSSDFPTTPGALDTTYNGDSGGGDGFVTKLNASGSALVYSTFLGGASGDGNSAIAVDGSGNAYITGRTDSSDFPTTPGAFDTTHNVGSDVFLSTLNPDGSALVYSTFLGGGAGDEGNAIAIDGSGNAYIAGRTSSSDFPVTPGAFDTSYNGGWDVIVSRLSIVTTAVEGWEVWR